MVTQEESIVAIKNAECTERVKKVFNTTARLGQARIETLMKELDTFCVNYDHYGTDKRANTRRRNCNKCWEELKATHCKGKL